MQQAWHTSKNRTCRLVNISRKNFSYQSKRLDQTPLINRIKEIAYARVRYGYMRIYILLRREGWQINHKRVHRLYCLTGLNLRHRKPRRHKSSSYRITRLPVNKINECWSMDFVCDQLFNGTRFRFLTVVDIFSRECLAIEVGKQLKGEDVVIVMNKIIQQRSRPKQIFLDNGSEFISKDLDKWAYENNVALAFSRPGKPTDNCYIESFNRSFRDECLNIHWFLSLDDAKIKAEKWREDYNFERPHSALNYKAPSVFAEQIYSSHG